MNLSEILDVPVPQPQANANGTSVAIAVPDVSHLANNDVTQDAIDARNNVRLMIAQGNQAATEMLALARDLKTPRAYEVASTMLKTMAELSHDLLEVHQKEQSLIADPTPTESGDIHIGQAVFIGSTSDLSELVKQRRAQRNANTQIIEAKAIRDVQAEASEPTVLPQEPAT